VAALINSNLVSAQHATFSLSTASAVQLVDTLPALVSSVAVLPAAISFRTVPAHLRSVAFILRNSTAFQASTLVDLVVVDKLNRRGRFAVKYSLLSTSTNQRYTLDIFADEVLTIPSLATPFVRGAKIFAAAG
jgi:NADH:ubiquinone oxidoreductase subunit C